MVRRQMRFFGIILTFLAAAFAVAALTLTGLIPPIFGNDFSKKVSYAGFGETPCPTEGATSVGPEGTELQILNSSSMSGIAGKLAASLEEIGYTITLVDNATTPFRGNVQFDASPNSVDAAYTLARYFEEPVRIKLKDLPAGTITIIQGHGYQGLLPAEERETVQSSRTALRPLSECLPVNPEMVDQLGLQQSGPQSGPQSGDDAEPDEE